MNPEILLALLSALLSILGGGIASAKSVQDLIRVLLKKPPQKPKESYSERLHRLTESLRTSSAEVDAVLHELSEVAKERQEAATKLEAQLADLQSREQTLQERVKALEKMPLPVAEYFASLTAAGEKRSAKRDYLLFGAGVVVSTLLSILFFLLQGK